MDIEIKNLLKGFREDPQTFAEQLVDDMYKSKLPEKVYNWHKRYKGDLNWNDYIINVLHEDYQFNNSDIVELG